MIRKSKPLSMAEAKEYMDKKDETMPFIKKFSNMEPEKAKEIREKIEGLDMIKIKETHICKIIDLLPKDKEDINKIFIDVSLDQDETQKILDTIKDFR
jgi:DNA-directed RNA polymerase subunit F